MSNIALLVLLLRGIQSAAAHDEQVSLWLVIGVAALVLLLSRAASTILIAKVSSATVTSLRRMVVDRALRAPLDRFERIGKSRIDSALLHDAPAVSAAVVRAGGLLVNAAVLITGAIYIALATLPGAIAVGAVAVATLPLYKRVRQASDQLANVANGVRETMLGRLSLSHLTMPVLKQSPRWRSHFRAEVVDNTFETMASLSRTQSALSAGRASVALGGIVASMYALLVLAGQIDSVVAAKGALIVWYLAGPIESIVVGHAIFAEGNLALGRLDTLLRSLPEEAEIDLRVSEIGPLIVYSEISYRYGKLKGSGAFELSPVSLVIQPGKSVFIVGRNGSGKTTLLKILTGLYAPSSGEISLDGRSLNTEEISGIRQSFGIVHDDSLFHLAPQVDRGAPRYKNLAKILGLAELVDRPCLSANELSTGERKRLALLHCLFDDKPIYVFDEWAANQDPVFKEMFYRKIIPDLLGAGKAVVVATHDEQYFDDADVLLVLGASNKSSQGQA